MSNGQLGYVHIPGMGDGPYRSIYQDMMGKHADKKAMIVDTRFNGGGDLVADLAMFFTGIPFITYETAAKVVGGEPTSRWTKPTLSIFNESMYSDGALLCTRIYRFKNWKKLLVCQFQELVVLQVGKGCLMVRIGALCLSVLKTKLVSGMENNQTNPLIQVKNMPGVIDKGRDQQLERSIRELLKDIK